VIAIVQSYGSTDTGRKRRRNEDAFVCEPPLFAVADGMGGAQAGEVASGLAAAALRESGANGGGEQRVVQLIQEANRRVHDRAISDATASGMGTTITAALVEPDGRVAFGHVGDSRAYLLRDGHLDQLTDDHSLVAELVRRGELSPQEAEVHPQRSVITRALGTDPDVDVDTFSIDARPGDVFLICSDGLSSYVDGTEIEDLIARNRFDLESAAKALIRAANRGGGDDNITAVLFALAGAGEPDERTREYATKPDEPEADDADTLHPEDNVRLPPEVLEADTREHPAVDDTIVVRMPAAVAEQAPDGAPPAAEQQPEPAPAEPEAAAETPEPAGLGRRVLASFVIALLIALIVVLTWWGLAR
jgi:PPM family protein phosphatase